MLSVDVPALENDGQGIRNRDGACRGRVRSMGHAVVTPPRSCLSALFALAFAACAHHQGAKTAPAPEELGTLHLVSVSPTPVSEGATPTSEAAPLVPQESPHSKGGQSAVRTPSDSSPTPFERHLRERVQRALLARKSLSYTAQHLSVRVHKRDVTLRGRARTEQERSEVERLIARMHGVRHVRNQVVVID